MMKDSSGKIGGLDGVDGDVGRLALEGVYYASDSTLRRFYEGYELIWLIFLCSIGAWFLKRNGRFAITDTALSAMKFRAMQCPNYLHLLCDESAAMVRVLSRMRSPTGDMTKPMSSLAPLPSGGLTLISSKLPSSMATAILISSKAK